MFTGIVVGRGRVARVDRSAEHLALTIESDIAGMAPGESIAVNGACLTVVEAGDSWFRVDAVVTTRGRTTLGDLTEGAVVNLERSLAADGRFGGHLVQGHVDGVGTIVAVERRDDAVLVDVRVPSEIVEVTVLHGSIALDGVSLTVNGLPSAGVVQVSLIPYTLAETTLGAWRVGDRVNVEGDLIGKYVRRLLRPWERGSVEVSE